MIEHATETVTEAADFLQDLQALKAITETGILSPQANATLLAEIFRQADILRVPLSELAKELVDAHRVGV